MQAPDQGAYGLRLAFPEEAEPCADLVPVDGSAPRVSVTWRHASPLADLELISDDRIVLSSRARSGVVVTRRPPSVELHLSEPVGLAALVHPLLTVPLSIFARWRGDVTIHAGAFETAKGAWGVIGGRAAGKSSMLGLLSQRGHPIVADDLLAIENGAVWAGPNCIDLRPDAVERFPAAVSIGEVTGRRRFRLSTPRGRPKVPLQGLFLLGWWAEPRVELERLAPREIVPLLFRQEYIGLLGWSDETEVLDLAALPAWRVQRPRDWAAAQQTVDRVLEATASVA
jgi:hypothetical protein